MNLHGIAPASTSSWCVYQFRHPCTGFDSDRLRRRNTIRNRGGWQGRVKENALARGWGGRWEPVSVVRAGWGFWKGSVLEMLGYRSGSSHRSRPKVRVSVPMGRRSGSGGAGVVEESAPTAYRRGRLAVDAASARVPHAAPRMGGSRVAAGAVSAWRPPGRRRGSVAGCAGWRSRSYRPCSRGYLGGWRAGRA